MRYSFYTGCSMDASAYAYTTSMEAVAEVLGIELKKIEDWNCCGATIASSVGGETAQAVMSLRNLALAEKDGLDVVVGCSSCYMNLAIANRRVQRDEHFKSMANEALAEGSLQYGGTLKVRHLLDVLVNEVGLDAIREKVKRPLTGLKVAGYVGCQLARTFPWEFDDPEHPRSLDLVMEALGAQSVPFAYKTKCCGASHTLPQADIAVSCVREILASAQSAGAAAMVSLCPMCQMNVDAYQPEVNKKYGTNFALPVLFFTQLMAVAFDLPPATWSLKYNIVSPFEALAGFGVRK